MRIKSVDSVPFSVPEGLSNTVREVPELKLGMRGHIVIAGFDDSLFNANFVEK
jgi:hypothetical protein